MMIQRTENALSFGEHSSSLTLTEILSVFRVRRNSHAVFEPGECRRTYWNRSGMALWIVFMAVTIVFIGGIIVAYLSRGVQSQLVYADAAMRAQYIAESGVNKLIARLLGRSYEERWFAGSPDSCAGIKLCGGTYDYFIQDTPDREYYVDIWVRGTYRDVKRAQFWRYKFEPGFLLSILRASISMTVELDETEFPKSSSAITLANHSAELDKIDQERFETLAKAEQITEKLRTRAGITEIIDAERIDPDSTPGIEISLPPPPSVPTVATPKPIVQVAVNQASKKNGGWGAPSETNADFGNTGAGGWGGQPANPGINPGNGWDDGMQPPQRRRRRPRGPMWPPW